MLVSKGVSRGFKAGQLEEKLAQIEGVIVHIPTKAELKAMQDSMNTKVDSLQRQLDQVGNGKGLTAVVERLNAGSEKFESIDGRLGSMEGRMGSLEQTVARICGHMGMPK